MLKKLMLLVMLLGSVAFGQNPNTPVYPGGVATDTDLLVAANRAQTTVASIVGISDSTINVVSTTPFIVPTTITIDQEIIKVCSKGLTTFSVCSMGRGFNGTSAAIHNTGVFASQNVVSYYFNQLAAEVKSIEANAFTNVMTTLGDSIYGGVGGTVTRLAGNTTSTREFLTSLGSGGLATAPVWSALLSGDIPNNAANTSGTAAFASAFDHTPTCASCTSLTTITAIAANGNLTETAIPTASGSQTGVLSSTDWTTFNGKQASGSYITALTGDVTASGPGSAVATAVNLPTGVTQAGYLLQSGIAAPGSGASGKGRFYFDSTSLNMAVVNASGTVNHGVQTKASASHNFLTAISDAGLVSATQPAYSDISGTPTLQYQTVDQAGSPLTQRAVINFTNNGMVCVDNSGATRTDCTPKNRQLTMVANSIGTTGTKACSVAEVAYTIVQVDLIADGVPTGANLQVDIMKIAFSSYTGVASPTSITSSDIPVIATGASNPRYTDAMLTGWTTSISAGDVVCINIKTAPTGGATWASLALQVI